MERIMQHFHFEPCYPTDTEMGKAIKKLLEPYEETDEVMDRIFIAESMRDARLDGLNPNRNGYVELATGEVVWINF